MITETKHTISLTPDEVREILLDKFKKKHPNCNFTDVYFDIGSDPDDDNYIGGYPNQIMTDVRIIGTITNENN